MTDEKAALERRILEVGKRMLSVPESAAYMGIGARTLYNRTGKGSKNPFPVKPKRIGGKVLFDRHELDAYLDDL